jgi:Uma2 family endonuclease
MIEVSTHSHSEVRPLKRTEFEQLAKLGAFEDERVELIEGVVLKMAPIGPGHSFSLNLLNELLVLALSGRAIVQPGGGLGVNEYSEPVPDIAVLPRRDFRRDVPQTALLVIEVADSSLRRDRGPKLALYAAAGVNEYWIVNLRDSVIEVHRKPRKRSYASVRRYTRKSSIALECFPDVTIKVGDVLP